MASKLFTGNYGSQLAQINTAPLERAGAAWGQAFASIGKDIAGAMEKYKLDKEKKEKEANSATMLESFFTNNPEVAKGLGIDPNDPQSISAGAKAGAKNPEAFGLISGLQQMEQRQAQAKRETELFKIKQDIDKLNLGQAKNKADMAKEAYDATKLDDVITMAANLQNKGETIPDSMKQQLYMYSNNLGRPLEQTKAEIDNKVASIRAAEQKEKQQYRKTEADIAYTQSSTLANQAKLFEAKNPDAGKTMTSISSQMEALSNKMFEIDGGFKPLKDIMASKDDWTKGGKFDNPALSTAIQSYNALAQNLSDTASQTKIAVRDKKTGKIIEMSVMEMMQKNMEEDKFKQHLEEAKKPPRRLRGNPIQPSFSRDEIIGLDPSSRIF